METTLKNTLHLRIQPRNYDVARSLNAPLVAI